MSSFRISTPSRPQPQPQPQPLISDSLDIPAQPVIKPMTASFSIKPVTIKSMPSCDTR